MNEMRIESKKKERKKERDETSTKKMNVIIQRE